ncbi:uncharacterized protein B0P05DRAFT_359846 [Gilbertella persicaria]|uniref:Calponin-homology (CH) domain-containing protein n=1 Tax=Rhizopus stolonifer TaxID=4846 RepID=A0A367JZQ3_RHIST|nr:uncharacterized protein B0P05DRAFT_359846 [Gilbertella persicaria]KAI8047561.1 hypothetical protein B0P05DRAFT_359846 [Gilbertella persicaria]RCH95377.1 hypothetical protein CU098_009799 [Rhizopus stolonifer]
MTCSLHQAQLSHENLYTYAKQKMLAKYWIETITGQQLPSNDFSCLKDGVALFEIARILLSHNKDPLDLNIENDPRARIAFFLQTVQSNNLCSFLSSLVYNKTICLV